MRLFNVESVSDAAIEAEEARARLTGTIEELKARVAPARFASDAIDEVKAKSLELAQGATDLTRRRPGAVAGAVAAGALLVARKPLWRLLRRVTGNKKAEPEVVDPKREDAKPWIERNSG